MSDTTPDPAAAIAEAKERYRAERDKRIAARQGRADRIATGDLKRYASDPFTTPLPRDPVRDEVDVVCIGGGFGGLLVGARMREAGFDRIRLIDTAGDVGGVWYWNRYPEAKCDVESLSYMPLLEETGYFPKDRYSAAPEIYEHARRIAKHFRLYEHSLFHTTVTEVSWDEASTRWHIHTDRGDDIVAQFVVIAIGPMNTIRLPDIPGIETFKGKSFHTSRWDYGYTGGSPTDTRMPGLADKKVGLIGTGATALQCMPPLAQSAKEFYLFQRTPSTVGIRGNRPIAPDDLVDSAPGWQLRRQQNFTAIWAGQPVDEDVVDDGWTYICKALHCSPEYEGLTGEERARKREEIDLRLMEEIRGRIDSVVQDKATADALKPYYNYFCKRPGWHDEYLDAFNLPNVHLVDTLGAGVEAVYEDGVIVRGEKYPLDCLIYGTGFVTETAGKLQLGFDLFGRDGVPLAERWKDGMRTLHGMTTAEFPNLFIIPGVNAQAVVTVNVVHMTQEYAQHIAYIASEVKARGMAAFELSHEAEAEWVETLLARRIDDQAFLEACTPGRNNYEGQVVARPRQNTVYGGGPIEYFALLAEWRASGDLPGMRLSMPGGCKVASEHLH